MEKISIARDFVSKLPKRHIIFAGISGSVSYDPLPDDDIDLLIITEGNHLWTVLFHAFILRRLIGQADICMSLCMDTQFATNLFSSSMDSLQRRDAYHVIPLIGEAYFREILTGIQRFQETPRQEIERSRGKESKRSGQVNPFLLILFPPMATYLYIKSLLFNHRSVMKDSPEKCYRVRIGPHHFYLDTEKYAKLRREADDR